MQAKGSPRAAGEPNRPTAPCRAKIRPAALEGARQRRTANQDQVTHHDPPMSGSL